MCGWYRLNTTLFQIYTHHSMTTNVEVDDAKYFKMQVKDTLEK